MSIRRKPRPKRQRNQQEKVIHNGRTYRGVHRFKVQKPYCSPARAIIFQALEEYGVIIMDYSERTATKSMIDQAKLMQIELKTRENLRYGAMSAVFLPMAIEATFCVPQQQANWTEYLLERTGKLAVVGGKVNSKNRKWANKHKGIMPPHGDRPWIESSCQKGKSEWDRAITILRPKKK